jgi:NAD(P)-dependent dehydrogenase (short-subunit alcohol dehydrogenase family)
MNPYINQLFNLSNKHVVVTGAGGHLCGAMAVGLAQAGAASITVCDLRLEKSQAVVKQINNMGFYNALAVQIDVTKKQSHQQVLNQVLDQFGECNVLINGAGINGPTPFFDIDEQEWNAIMDSQLKGTMFGCQVFGEYMVGRNQGSIINISSASADPPLSKAFTYSVAKAGVVNLTKNLAREWGTQGVRVNTIRPGFFPTEWNRKNFITAEREAAILGHTPMRRYGEPDELVGAAIYLASDASRFVTGTELTVDGGFACQTI